MISQSDLSPKSVTEGKAQPSKLVISICAIALHVKSQDMSLEYQIMEQCQWGRRNSGKTHCATSIREVFLQRAHHDNRSHNPIVIGSRRERRHDPRVKVWIIHILGHKITHVVSIFAHIDGVDVSRWVVDP